MEVPRDKVQLRDNEALISPPFVSPVYQCATAVTVRGFIRHARIQVEVAGIVVVDLTAGYPEPNGQTFPLPAPLVAGQLVRARQRVDGVWSSWSAAVTVRSHLEDFPAGPPRPQINPAPVYECGARTGVANLLTGCNVWITADGAEVGRVNGAAEHQGVNVNPDYTLAQDILAFADLCGDPSPLRNYRSRSPHPTPCPRLA